MTRSYMFNDRDDVSNRRRREDQQVELRRQRTEELLKKKRASAQQADASSTFTEYRTRLFSESLEEVYNAAFECRTKLSVECNPPIDQVIKADLVPRFVELLQMSAYEHFLAESRTASTMQLIAKTRIESAWVITNVASGSTDQTMIVTEAGAVPHLVAMLGEADDAIIDQSVWALGNIAGDNERMRDLVLQFGALPTIVHLIERYKTTQAHIKILRNLVWLLSNLSRGRNPPPPEEDLRMSYSVARELIHVNDADVVSDCAWCLSYIVDVNADLTQELIASDVLSRCYSLLHEFAVILRAKPGFVRTDSNSNSVLSKIGAHAVCPIIRMLGNMSTGTDDATEAVIQTGFPGLFKDIFYLYDNRKLPRIRKEICWLLSNIAAGTDSQRLSIISSDLLGLLIDALMRYELYIRREALFAVTNLLYFCAKNSTGYQYLPAFLDIQLMQALQAYMAAVGNTPELQAQVLDAVRYALEAGTKLQAERGENPVTASMVDIGLVDEIEDLQMSKNSVVVQKSYNIIMNFFDGVDD